MNKITKYTMRRFCSRTAAMALIIVLVVTMIGCGDKNSHFSAESQIELLEKRMNMLDAEYILDHLYHDPVDTDNDLVIAAAFVADVVSGYAGTGLELLRTAIINALEEYDILTRKDFQKALKELRKTVLDHYSFEITSFEVLENQVSRHENSHPVYIQTKITCIVFGTTITHTGDAYLEYDFQDEEWKFHLIKKSELRKRETQDDSSITGTAGVTEESEEIVETTESGSELETGNGLADHQTDTEQIGEPKYYGFCDNTVSVKGYMADPYYKELFRQFEHVHNSMINSRIYTLREDDDEHLYWGGYEGYLTKGITHTEPGDAEYYTLNGSFIPGEGPIQLFVKQAEDLAIMNKESVFVLATDLQEQGAALHTIGTEIRDAYMTTGGSFAVGVYSFDFYFKGVSYITDPDDITHIMKPAYQMDGKEKRPYYMIVFGYDKGVEEYTRELSISLDRNNISYEYFDNIRPEQESETVDLSYQITPEAVAAEIRELNKNRDAEALLEEYLLSHTACLVEKDPEEGSAIPDHTFSYSYRYMDSRREFKGLFHLGLTAELPETVDAESCQVEMDQITVSEIRDGEVIALPRKEWEKYLQITGERNRVDITSVYGKNAETFRNKDLQVTITFKKTSPWMLTYPDWIADKDLSLSGVLMKGDHDAYNLKTLDLDNFIRSLMGLRANETNIDYTGITYEEATVILTGLKNK